MFAFQRLGKVKIAFGYVKKNSLELHHYSYHSCPSPLVNFHQNAFVLSFKMCGAGQESILDLQRENLM